VLRVVGDVGALLRALLAAPRSMPRARWPCAPPMLAPSTPVRSPRVRPEALMDAIQRQVVDASDAILLAESGNAFVWTTHRLRFATPGRYRVSTSFGAMGHAVAGVVGAALADGARRRAVAVVGDGAMLMHNEINTAVKHGARAVWIVLNDGRYGMCAQGMQTLGLHADADFPAVDFAAFARAQGARGLRVQGEDELDAALAQAMAADGPVVVDVLVDLQARAPAGSRNRGLARQLAGAGEVSFPTR
jgi:thiamine pyrophosphate-dependent acetolactate synthase large subunit-like protein